MTDLEFLQLLIIFTLVLWIFLQAKKKSKFGASPSLEIPWNVNFEKNKVYVLLKDPLSSIDLGIETRTVYTGPLVRYVEFKGYTTTEFPIGITILEEDRLDYITNIDEYISFQNKIIDDLNVLTTTIVNFNGIKVNFDYSALTKLNVSDLDKYNSLKRGMAYNNLIECEDFEKKYLPDGTIIEPGDAWDVSDTVIGSMNTNLSGGVLYYQNWGDEYDIADESSVSFFGGVQSIGRYSRLITDDEFRVQYTNEYGQKTIPGALYVENQCTTNTKFFGETVTWDNVWRTCILAVIRQFPPHMYDGTYANQTTSQAAVMKHVNLQNNKLIIPPYLRQQINLKKNMTYTLSYFYFGFIPLFINLIDVSTSIKTTILTQNDVGYNTWFYRTVDFTITKDGVYVIEFTPMLIGNELLYPGTDPEGNSHKYYGQCMIQKVILKVNDSKTKFIGYSDLLYSPGVQNKTLYVLLNGKLMRLNMNTYNSLEPAIINKRRDDISKFITKNYIQ